MGRPQSRLPTQAPPPTTSNVPDPVNRPRSPPNVTGVGRSSSSSTSPLRDHVIQTYAEHDKVFAYLKKSLHEPAKLEGPILPLPPRIDEEPAPERKDALAQLTIKAPSNTSTSLYPTLPPAFFNRVLSSPIPRYEDPYGRIDAQRLAALRGVPSRCSPPRAPRYRAFLISNNDNEDRLDYVEYDVEMMKACLLQDWGLKEEDIRIEKTEGDETSVRRGFVWFFKEAACGDTLILFISSHVKFDPSRNLAYFLSSSFNAAYFWTCINSLPRGCNLVIFLETCYGIRLVKVEYIIKRMQDRNTIITKPLNISMGATSAIVSALAPSQGIRNQSILGASPQTAGPSGTPPFRAPLVGSSHRRPAAVSAAPYAAVSGPSTRSPQTHKRLPGHDQAVVAAPPDYILGVKTKANVTLWASEGPAYESYAPTKGGVLVNAFSAASEQGHKTCSAIYNFMERMFNGQNDIRAKRDKYKSPKELAELGQRDQCLHFRSTSSDASRILAEDAIPMPGAYVP